jgi:hypothetical protein
MTLEATASVPSPAERRRPNKATRAGIHWRANFDGDGLRLEVPDTRDVAQADVFRRAVGGGQGTEGVQRGVVGAAVRMVSIMARTAGMSVSEELTRMRWSRLAQVQEAYARRGGVRLSGAGLAGR